MSKLASRMRQTRTGQFMPPVDMGGNRGGSGGGCFAPPQGQPQSWGSACPSGHCTSEDLAANLGRSFGGERYGCRELPYWLMGTSDAGGLLTLSQNAIVTICPTRIVVVAEDGAAVAAAAVLERFDVGNQNQIAGDPLPLRIVGLTGYQSIPFVTDCIKAGIPFEMEFSGLDATTDYFVGLIGPAIG